MKYAFAMRVIMGVVCLGIVTFSQSRAISQEPDGDVRQERRGDRERPRDDERARDLERERDEDARRRERAVREERMEREIARERREGDRPERGNLEQRRRHVAEAIEQLQAAGLHDLAAEVRDKAHDQLAPGRRDAPGVPPGPDPELREHVEHLTNSMREMQNVMREVFENLAKSERVAQATEEAHQGLRELTEQVEHRSGDLERGLDRALRDATEELGRRSEELERHVGSRFEELERQFGQHVEALERQTAERFEKLERYIREHQQERD
ncbi:MAG: hypothetical protein KDA60_16485 [Planctomycetales bacterium]|nr:hypothetical protein [Planctomycetales bacterium]